MKKRRLKLLRFINSNKNWRKVLTSSPYNLIIRDEYPYTIIKYNQLFSDFKQEMVREARGLILKKIGNKYKIVCMPYTKFFNIGDPNAKPALYKLAHRKEWNVTEKIDGSLIKLWFDEYWHVSTNGTIDANKAELQFPKDGLFSFGDMFRSIANKLIDYDKLDKNYTYLFELIGLENKVIVTYEDNDLYYLGRINNHTLLETPYLEDECLGVEKLKRPKHRLIKHNGNIKKDFLDVQKYVHNLTRDDEHFEGVVLSDNNYSAMVKIKSDSYMELFYQKGNGVFSPKKVLRMILDEQDDDVLSMFPEYKPQFDEVRRALCIWLEKIKDDLRYMDNHTWETKKDFAEWAKNTTYSPITFAAYGKDYWADGWLENKVKNISIDNLLVYIGIDVRKEEDNV